jgi:4-hydroxy-tetrahydrodipicolinate synthase
MSASDSTLRGVLAPVLTPFEADLTPSVPRFVRHCRALVAQGVGLAVFGTNSEGNSLSVAEKRALLDALIGAGLPPSRMMPGTGACALPDAIELTRHAVLAGCAGVLMLPPFYYKSVSEEGLYRSFAAVIDAVADPRLRVYLYHIPPVAQVGIPLPLIERLLARYPGVVAGLKDSSGDFAHTASAIEAFGAGGFDVFAGSETFLLQTLRAGGAGCISATANVNGAAIAASAVRWQEPAADLRQSALDRVRAVFQKRPMIAAMKAAMASGTGDEGWCRVRPPLVELDADTRRGLDADLDAIGYARPTLAVHSQDFHRDR